MSTNLSNLIVPSVFAKYVGAQRTLKNAIVTSGAAIRQPQLSAFLAGGASKFSLPYWGALSATATLPSTNYESNVGVQKMSANKQEAVRMVRNITPVAITALEAMLIGEDPVSEAANEIARIQTEIRQASLLNVLAGVTGADTAALTYDAGTETTLTADILLSAVANKWGDSQRGLGGLTLVMNSTEYLDLQRAQLTGGTNVSFANAINVGFGVFLGASIVVDDATPANTVYVVRRGGIAFGEAAVAVPFEIERKASAGDGGGADVLHARDLYTYHVLGTSFAGTPAGEVVTEAELATVGNWDIKQAVKNCGVIAVIHD